MKSQARVKQQRRIKSIPNYGDNPMSAEQVELQANIAKGVVKLDRSPNRRERRSYLQRKSSSKVVRHQSN